MQNLEQAIKETKLDMYNLINDITKNWNNEQKLTYMLNLFLQQPEGVQESILSAFKVKMLLQSN